MKTKWKIIGRAIFSGRGEGQSWERMESTTEKVGVTREGYKTGNGNLETLSGSLSHGVVNDLVGDLCLTCPL